VYEAEHFSAANRTKVFHVKTLCPIGARSDKLLENLPTELLGLFETGFSGLISGVPCRSYENDGPRRDRLNSFFY